MAFRWIGDFFDVAGDGFATDPVPATKKNDIGDVFAFGTDEFGGGQRGGRRNGDRQSTLGSRVLWKVFGQLKIVVIESRSSARSISRGRGNPAF